MSTFKIFNVCRNTSQNMSSHAESESDITEINDGDIVDQNMVSSTTDDTSDTLFKNKGTII